ncbi:hypothetical protein MMC20_002618 [Loxospora ochrophaea]|nr:hypothetical protein [Loxospora ochrophaea]
MEEQSSDYKSWSSGELVGRVTYLEKQLKDLTLRLLNPTLDDEPFVEIDTWVRYGIPPVSTPSISIIPPSRPRNSRANRVFDSSKYSTRLIALKLAYLGRRYNGFEYHANNKTPRPTIEEELWKALNKARLVFPIPDSTLREGEVNWKGCDYSKCGRTDRGVSAFGQVVGIRVRSNRKILLTGTDGIPAEEHSRNRERSNCVATDTEITAQPLEKHSSNLNTPSSLEDPSVEDSPSFDPIGDEIPYPRILNRLLPPDIRILAWCPTPPADFSARFSCKERQYRYFFTQPAFNPTHGRLGLSCLNSNRESTCGRNSPQRKDGWLDIDAMRKAAKNFEGLHDFRSFCKIDPSKQMDNFERRIFRSEILEVDPFSMPAAYTNDPTFSEVEALPPSPDLYSQSLAPKLYAFSLDGSAFLWHQVRHMVAILFLIGQGLESPDLITELLDIGKTPQKPMYEMAQDAPLVLWDCVFPSKDSAGLDALQWVYIGDDAKEHHATNAPLSMKGDGKFGIAGVVDDLWKLWRCHKMDEVLAGTLLNIVVRQGRDDVDGKGLGYAPSRDNKPQSQRMYYGGDTARYKGKYIPVLELPRMDGVEAINMRYALRRGFDQSKESSDKGFPTSAS